MNGTSTLIWNGTKPTQAEPSKVSTVSPSGNRA